MHACIVNARFRPIKLLEPHSSKTETNLKRLLNRAFQSYSLFIMALLLLAAPKRAPKKLRKWIHPKASRKVVHNAVPQRPGKVFEDTRPFRLWLDSYATKI